MKEKKHIIINSKKDKEWKIRQYTDKEKLLIKEFEKKAKK